MTQSKIQTTADAPGWRLEPQASGLAWHTLSVERVLRAEEVDAQRGLSSAEAASRAGRFAPNELAAGRAEPRWLAFIRYSGPMQIVLLGGRAVNGNPAAWIILLSVACAVVIAVPTGLWVSWRRERSRDYNPAHRASGSHRPAGQVAGIDLDAHRPIPPFPVKETNYGRIRDEGPWSVPMGWRFAEINRGLFLSQRS